MIRDKYKNQEYHTTALGQRASVRVDAVPGVVFPGRVRSVAGVASQSDWMNTDVKLYQTTIMLDEIADNLKPGMNAEVTITTGSPLKDVLTIPVQAVVGSVELGKVRKCFVITPDGPKEREITVGGRKRLLPTGRRAIMSEGRPLT